MSEPIISREDALMFRDREARELQRELDRLHSRIDAIKLEALETTYNKKTKKIKVSS